MYAIVEIGGHQFKVEKDQRLYVNRLEGKEGAKVSFDNVLLIDNKGKVNVGVPVVDGAQVTAKILQHLKDKKVIVFKKKRRKGYQVKNGHRQFLSEILIEKIDTKGAKKKTSAKKEEKAEAKTEVKKTTAKAADEKKATTKKTTAGKKPEVKSETKPVTKKAEAKTTGTQKKAAAKKPAAKKTTAKKEPKKKE